MSERIEAFTADHLDECANLLMVTFNAEPWNDSYTYDTANPIRLEAVTGPSRSLGKQVRYPHLSPEAVVYSAPLVEEGTSSD